jgi:hypothetical protein
MGWKDDYAASELERHQAEVEDFTGEIARQQNPNLAKEFADSNLGRRKTVPTSGAIPITLANQTALVLAEMSLSTAMEVDVAFSIPNRFGAPVGAPAPLDIGDGTVRIEWGTPSGVQHFVDVDPRQGWVYPFTASFLRVTYFPIDPNNSMTSNLAAVLPVNQSRDLVVQASIGPRANVSREPLTKTVFTGAVPVLLNSIGPVPRFSRTAQLMLRAGTAIPQADVSFHNPSGAAIARWSCNSSANGGNLTTLLAKYPVPQDAASVQLAGTNAGTNITDSSIIFELGV